MGDYVWWYYVHVSKFLQHTPGPNNSSMHFCRKQTWKVSTGSSNLSSCLNKYQLWSKATDFKNLQQWCNSIRLFWSIFMLIFMLIFMPQYAYFISCFQMNELKSCINFRDKCLEVFPFSGLESVQWLIWGKYFWQTKGVKPTGHKP